jgi:hypothetical protein
VCGEIYTTGDEMAIDGEAPEPLHHAHRVVFAAIRTATQVDTTRAVN